MPQNSNENHTFETQSSRNEQPTASSQDKNINTQSPSKWHKSAAGTGNDVRGWLALRGLLVSLSVLILVGGTIATMIYTKIDIDRTLRKIALANATENLQFIKDE